MAQKSKACTVELPRNGFADALRHANYVATSSPQKGINHSLKCWVVDHILIEEILLHPKRVLNTFQCWVVAHNLIEEPTAAIVAKLLIPVRNRITLLHKNCRLVACMLWRAPET